MIKQLSLSNLFMNEPAKTKQERKLSAVPDDVQSEVQETDEIASGFKGGFVPPPSRGAGVWFFFCLGLLLIAASAWIMTIDPATKTYHQKPFLFFDEMRVSLEHFTMLLGCACFFTSLGYWRARRVARKVERDSKGQVRSMGAKRLDKMSDDGMLDAVGRYLAFLFQGR